MAMAIAVGVTFTLTSLFHGATTESQMQMISSADDRRPFTVKVGCGSNEAHRAQFESLNPGAYSHTDMLLLSGELEASEELKEQLSSDIWTISTPCISKTTTKDDNLSDYHPGDKLVDLQVDCIKIMRPPVVLGET
jgi:hypothetical protein